MNIRTITGAYTARSLPLSPKGSARSAQQRSSAEPEERVELSDASRSLQAVREKVDQTPEVRTELVREMREKIFYNGYPMSSDLAATIEKLIEKRVVLGGE